MKQKGFSLIELLIVIAIIASIVALAIPNYLSARQRAQDVKAKSELVQLKNALRLYYNDYNHYPPSAPPGILMGCGTNGDQSCVTTCTPAFATGAACDTVYMKQLPTSPVSSILYTQTQNGDDFCLRVVLNNKSDPDISTSSNRCFTSCGTCGTGKYCVCAD